MARCTVRWCTVCLCYRSVRISWLSAQCGVCLCFFFFQAEDGIRDLTVTGVQTCALPISLANVCEGVPGLPRTSPLQPSPVSGTVSAVVYAASHVRARAACRWPRAFAVNSTCSMNEAPGASTGGMVPAAIEKSLAWSPTTRTSRIVIGASPVFETTTNRIPGGGARGGGGGGPPPPRGAGGKRRGAGFVEHAGARHQPGLDLVERRGPAGGVPRRAVPLDGGRVRRQWEARRDVGDRGLVGEA